MTLLRRRARFVAVAIVLAATAGLAAQTATPSGKSFLWKIQTGSKVLYLAGSVHALNADAYPLSAALERAFNESGTLVEEIDLAEAESPTLAPVLLAKGMYLDGRRFDGSVSKETAALVAAHMKQSGLPVELVQSMKPWMVMMTVAALEVQKAGLDPNLGLDKHFYTRAKNAGKEIVGLETAESQIDRLDRMSDPLQEQLLRSALEDLDLQRSEWKTLMSAWRGGDAVSMEKMLLSSFTPYPAAYQSLIVERNRNWMPLIDTCFAKPQPCLVVVGAAHLVGPDGLLTMMRGKGYRVEQQ